MPVLVGFLAPTVGLILLIGATRLWQFWAASALQSVVGTTLILGSALAIETFPKRVVGSALAWLNATPPLFAPAGPGFRATPATTPAASAAPSSAPARSCARA